ncbi:MAG TPA: pyrimidine/purine nucleoside phosphorylase [Polyangiales bacterium]
MQYGTVLALYRAAASVRVRKTSSIHRAGSRPDYPPRPLDNKRSFMDSSLPPILLDQLCLVALSGLSPFEHLRLEGELLIRFAGRTEWRSYPAGTAFEVAAKSGFDVKAEAPSGYLCEFL